MCIVCVRASLIQPKASLPREQAAPGIGQVYKSEVGQVEDEQGTQNTDDRIAGDKAGDIKVISVESTWSRCAQGSPNPPVARVEEGAKPPDGRKVCIFFPLCCLEPY